MNDGIYTTIDADTLVYLIAYKFRDSDDTEGALIELDSFVRTLLDNTSASYYAGFLGGDKCFRYGVAKTKPYKGNRPESPDWYKKWSGPFKAYLRDEWNFDVVDGIEADDAVCIYQTWCREHDKNSIMCHGDKDLYQIEGNHYNLRTHKRDYIDKITGYKNMYKQVLTGDPSDAIIGCRGVGKVGASALIDSLSTEDEMRTAVLNKYYAVYKEEGPELYTEMYTLCKLLTHSDTLPILFYPYTPKVLSEEPGIDLTGLFDLYI